MVTTRYLGAGFTAVHAPGDGIKRVHWLLDQGLAGCEVAPAPRAVDWRATHQAMAGAPAAICSVRVDPPLDPRREPLAGLSTGHKGDLSVVQRRIADACSLAASLGVRQIVLEAGSVLFPGERGRWDLADPIGGWTREQGEAQLARRCPGLHQAADHLCRNLWGVLRAHPDFRFALTLSRDVASTLDPETLGWVLEDLGSSGRLSYWHDAPLAALRAQWLGEDQGAWLEGFGAQLAGLTVGDPWDGGAYGPPGTGLVDYPLIASYLPKGPIDQPLVVELDPPVPTSELPGVLAFLDKVGL